MSAIQEAFARLGIKPQPSEPRPSERERRIESAPDFGLLDDAALIAAMRDLEQDKIVITEELALDLAEGEPRGRAWRQSAGRARAYKVAHLALARAEQERRAEASKRAKVSNAARANLEAGEQRIREMEAKAEAHRLLIEAQKAQKEASREKKEAAWQCRQAGLAKMFLAAASRNLSKNQLAEIWAVARQMFPDATEWDGL